MKRIAKQQQQRKQFTPKGRKRFFLFIINTQSVMGPPIEFAFCLMLLLPLAARHILSALLLLMLIADR